MNNELKRYMLFPLGAVAILALVYLLGGIPTREAPPATPEPTGVFTPPWIATATATPTPDARATEAAVATVRAQLNATPDARATEAAVATARAQLNATPVTPEPTQQAGDRLEALESCLAGVAEYIDTLMAEGPNVLAASDAFYAALSELSAEPSLLFSETWKASVLETLQEQHLLAARLAAPTPPAPLAEADTLVDAAANHLVEAAAAFQLAIEQNDTGALVFAANSMGNATASLHMAGEALDALDHSLDYCHAHVYG